MTIMEEQMDMPTEMGADPLSKILDVLTENPEICFKSQQRNDPDLTKTEKTAIALEEFNKSKLNFLLKFGRYLTKFHLDFFQQFTHGHTDSSEIHVILKDLISAFKKRGPQVNVKNRRYEALKQMIREDSYFSEIEMMKRNPLLYDELIGQFLTEAEKTARDRIDVQPDTTLVKVILEGIEREDAKLKQKEQENTEGMDVEKEENSSSSDSEPRQGYSQWGEFHEDAVHNQRRTRNKARKKKITSEEQDLLREEFTSSMYQSFLEGNDEDFDYSSVDNNERYDNVVMLEEDEEDKYFDSEEPATVQNNKDECSEDELDIFMSALNDNPCVAQLSKDIQRM